MKRTRFNLQAQVVTTVNHLHLMRIVSDGSETHQNRLQCSLNATYFPLGSSTEVPHCDPSAFPIKYHYTMMR